MIVASVLKSFALSCSCRHREDDLEDDGNENDNATSAWKNGELLSYIVRSYLQKDFFSSAQNSARLSKDAWPASGIESKGMTEQTEEGQSQCLFERKL
jgi:hypothetical protein